MKQCLLEVPKGWEKLSFYLFIASWTLGFSAFILGPIVASLTLGFTRYDIILPAKWTELENFRDLIADPLLFREMRK